MSTSTDAYWLALRRVRGVGARVARMLLEKFGDAPASSSLAKNNWLRRVFTGRPRKISSNSHNSKNWTRNCANWRGWMARLIRWTRRQLPGRAASDSRSATISILTRRLCRPGTRNCVAIVGARAASDAGRHMAHRLALELAAKGITVVSGLARGIDGEAHRGALEANGRTIAVLGCGIDIIYPPEHRKLADSIVAGNGALISELPLGSQPVPENFPVRNRLIAGLSLGVVIVEAAEKSGSLITARLALEQNRQVFAVPGSPLTGKSRGSNRLLKEGAKLVECVEDVIEELAPQWSVCVRKNRRLPRRLLQSRRRPRIRAGSREIPPQRDRASEPRGENPYRFDHRKFGTECADRARRLT